MAAYNRRDLFSHWVRKEQPARRPCHHACCRGMRPHPENYPVIKRNAYLRYSSMAELQRYHDRHGGDTERDEAIRSQIYAELQRRDEADARKAASAQRRYERRVSRNIDRREHVEAAWADAERATRGHMLNRRGREAGVDERTLFTGPESRARKYASEELLNHWETHPRPTAAFFRGEDTTMGYSSKRSGRKRLTSEEAYWRDAYERAEYERGRAS